MSSRPCPCQPSSPYMWAPAVSERGLLALLKRHIKPSLYPIEYIHLLWPLLAHKIPQLTSRERNLGLFLIERIVLARQRIRQGLDFTFWV